MENFLTLTENTCTLDGNYKLSYTKICNPLQTNCPLTDGERAASIGYSLQSENFCAEVSVEVSLVGNITVYQDAALTQAKTSFIVGTRAYFLVSVDSDLNKPVKVISFSKTAVVTVTVRRENDKTPIRLVEKKSSRYHLGS